MAAVTVTVISEPKKIVCHCFHFFPIYLPWSDGTILGCRDLHFLSSILAWRIPGTVEPGGLPSVGSHRVGHDWSDLAAAADVFLEFSCFFYDPTDVGNLISGSPAFSKSSLYIWKFSVHVLLKPSSKDFEHDLASMWNEYNCAVVWAFFDIALLWDWNENWPFPVL